MMSGAHDLAELSDGAFPTLACRTAGQGPALALIHGGSGSWTHWARNIDVLAQGCRVHAFDLPGCGDSPDFPTGWSDEAYFDWVAQALLSTCDGPILLTGFSFGGSVAAAVAPRLGARLAALCLVAPGSFGKPAARDVTVRPMRPRDGVEIDERANARHNLCQIMFADPSSADDATIDLQIANVRRARFPSRRISWQDRILADLTAISAPTHFIWGAADRMATPSPQSRGDLVRTVRPEAQVDMIEGAGHWVQYERATEFNAAMLSWLHTIHPENQ